MSDYCFFLLVFEVIVIYRHVFVNRIFILNQMDWKIPLVTCYSSSFQAFCCASLIKVQATIRLVFWP